MNPQPPIERSRILAFGSAFPRTVMSSEETARRIGATKDWIEERTGIQERRFLGENEQNSDLAAAAALQALERAGKSPLDIDLILGCTNSPDRWMPGLAPIVQAKIGAHNGSAAYDIITACAGWMSGLQAADAFIRAGVYKNVLVIGSEAMSRFLNWNDKTTCVLFGDGAGASLVAAGEPGCAGEILSLKVRADGRSGDILEFPGTGSRLPASHEVVDSNLHCVRMDGEKVFSYAIRHMSAICEEVLKENGLSLEDIDWFVPHQANAWIIKLVAERLNFPEEKVAINIHKYGNTTAATVPTCFDEYVQAGKIKRGQLVMIASFGGGLSWAGGLIRW